MTIETISKNGYILKLDYEQDANYFFENEEIFYGLNAGIDLSNSRNYQHLEIGDKVDFELCNFLQWLDIGDEIFDKEEIAIFKLFEKQYHYCKVYLYSHGADTISTRPFSCRWDSGTAGIAFIKKTDFQKSKIGCVKISDNADKRDTLAMKYLQKQVEYIDFYIRGDVYYYTISSENDENEIIDTCNGSSYIGYFSDFKKEAELEFNNFLENQKTNN